MELLELAQGSAFHHHALSLLMCHEAENNLLLSSTLALSQSGERGPRFFLIRDRSQTLGAAMIGADTLFLAQSEPAAVTMLACELRRRNLNLSRVLGEDATAQTFAKAWCDGETGGHTWHRSLHHFVLVLEKGAISALPPSMAGRVRPATSIDLPLVSTWSHEFVAECALVESTERTTELAQHALSRKQIYLCEKGGPRCMALISGHTENLARISQVYTPEKFRGQGFAGQLVFTLTQQILKEGRGVVLFTETKNALANRLYERIGFRKTGAFSEIHFNFG